MIYLTVALALGAAVFLMIGKPNHATAFLLVDALLVAGLAAGKRPFLLTGLIYAVSAVVFVLLAVAINPALYRRIRSLRGDQPGEGAGPR